MGGLLRKLQKGKAREKMKGNEKGTGKGNSALVVGIYDSASGVRARAPAENEFHVL